MTIVEVQPQQVMADLKPDVINNAGNAPVEMAKEMDAPVLGPQHMGEQFVLVSERGWWNFRATSFANEAMARAQAANQWCNWILFRAKASDRIDKGSMKWTEVTHGGIGMSYNTIMRHVTFSGELTAV